MNDNVTTIGQNTIAAAKFEPFITRHENEQSEIDKIMEEAKKKCQPHRENQKTIKDEAADAGFRKQPFNGVLKERKLIRKANEIRSKMADDQTDDYDQMKHALGMQMELPLGGSKPKAAAAG